MFWLIGLMKILLKKVYNKFKEGISNTQFGFRDGFGIREPFFGINVFVSLKRLNYHYKNYGLNINLKKAKCILERWKSPRKWKTEILQFLIGWSLIIEILKLLEKEDIYRQLKRFNQIYCIRMIPKHCLKSRKRSFFFFFLILKWTLNLFITSKWWFSEPSGGYFVSS